MLSVMSWLQRPQPTSPSALKAPNRPSDTGDQREDAKRGGHAAIGQPECQHEADASSDRSVLVFDQQPGLLRAGVAGDAGASGCELQTSCGIALHFQRLESAEFSATFRRPIACARSLRATAP